MDHLPTPKNAQRIEQVPYVCSKPYDRGSFLEYPFRENKSDILPYSNDPSYTLVYQRLKQLQTSCKTELEGFLQTWLFFGLINEFLGEFCRSETFVRNNPDGAMILSTSNLLGAIHEWVSSIKKGLSTLTYDHVAKCLRTVFETVKAVGSTLDHSIKLSVLSLGELFELAANEAFEIKRLTVDNKCPAAWRSLMSDEYWTVIMQQSGWCPSQISVTLKSTMYLQVQE